MYYFEQIEDEELRSFLNMLSFLRFSQQTLIFDHAVFDVNLILNSLHCFLYITLSCSIQMSCHYKSNLLHYFFLRFSLLKIINYILLIYRLELLLYDEYSIALYFLQISNEFIELLHFLFFNGHFLKILLKNYLNFLHVQAMNFPIFIFFNYSAIVKTAYHLLIVEEDQFMIIEYEYLKN